MSKNVIIGQSGGPTAVINSSLAGVYKAACSLGADKVYGMKYGIEGLLKEEMLELNVLLDDRMSIAQAHPVQLSGQLPLQAAGPGRGFYPVHQAVHPV